VAATTAHSQAVSEEKARLRMKNFVDDVIGEIENTSSEAAAKRSEKAKTHSRRSTLVSATTRAKRQRGA
jgi:hypothetical protein